MRLRRSPALLFALSTGFAMLPSLGHPETGGCDATSACVPEPGFFDEPAAAVLPPIVITAPQADVGGGGGGGGDLVGAAARPEDTARIVVRLNESFRFCAALQAREYVVDCVNQELRDLTEALPATGDYAPLRSALEGASSRLEEVVRTNRSTVLPPAVARSTGPSGKVSSRPLRPVATERAEATISEAAAILQETETQLLQSVSDFEPEQAAAIDTVSATIESGTVLLLAI